MAKKERLQVYLLPETRAAAVEVAAEEGISLTAWTQLVVAEAVKNYQVKQARRRAIAGCDGRAPL